MAMQANAVIADSDSDRSDSGEVHNENGESDNEAINQRMTHSDHGDFR